MDGNRLVTDVGLDFIKPYLSLFDGDRPVNQTWAAVTVDVTRGSAIIQKLGDYRCLLDNQHTLAEMGPYIAALCGHVRPLQEAADRPDFPYMSLGISAYHKSGKRSSIQGIAEDLTGWAVVEGCEVVLRYLLDTYPHVLPRCGRLLRDLCDDENPVLTIVSVLLEKGASPNEREAFISDEYSMPLHAALSSFSWPEVQSDLVELLIRNGADINAITSYSGYSTMHCVAVHRRTGFAQLVDLLLRHGADINAKDLGGYSPLVVMCCRSLESNSIPIHHGIQELIRRGADPHLGGHNGYTALHFASFRAMLLPVRELLYFRVPAECRTACGRTPLHLSCMTFIMYLMDGTPYKDWTSVGSTSPFWCVREDRHYQLSELFAFDISSNQIESDRGSTSSHVEMLQESQGSSNNVRHFVGHHNNSVEEEEEDLASQMPQNPLHNYEECPRPTSASTQMESGFRSLSPRHTTPLQAQSESPPASSNVDFASDQPHRQVEVDQRSERSTARDLSIESPQTMNLETTRESSELSRQRLLDSDHISFTQTSSLPRVRSQESLESLESQVSLRIDSITRWTVYSRERADVIELLVKAGADTNSRDAELCTPLHYAALAGDLFLVELLIRRLGADPTAQDGHGRTALHFACCGFRYGANWVYPDEVEEIIALRRGIIGLLIDRGVDADIMDWDGKTALDCARQHEEDKISEFLEVRMANRAPVDPGERMEHTENMIAEQLKRDTMWKPVACERS
ncbi:hypothetical protein CHU98_g6981 [Xylaria longipes]|nr:hypothetical protein CHU98_g6981 [Xylaria longipes]